jgi:hypothetical protein
MRHIPLRFWISPALALAVTVVSTGACGSSESSQRSRGEDVLKATSATIAGAQALSFSVTESLARVSRTGDRRVVNIERRVTARRPDRLWVRTVGDRDVEASTTARV